MFSKTLGKAALFGASTVASLAFTGTMMANSAQAASISYYSEFSVDLNSLDNEVITGDFSFTKTDLNNGFFSYDLTDFNLNASLNLGPLNFDQSLTLDDVKANSDLFEELNDTVIEPPYQTILGSVLGTTGGYIGDGDFPPENLTFGFDFGNGNFEEDDFDLALSGQDLLSAAQLLSGFLEIPSDTAQLLAVGAFGQGGAVSFTTTTVPEPATIFALGAVGVGLTATRRRSTNKKIKQKTAV